MMSCALSDKIKGILSGNGGTCSTGYAHTVMAAVQAVATCADQDVDEATSKITAKYLGKLMESNPNLQADLETVAASDPEIAAAIASFKDKYGSLNVLDKPKTLSKELIDEMSAAVAAQKTVNADGSTEDDEDDEMVGYDDEDEYVDPIEKLEADGKQAGWDAGVTAFQAALPALSRERAFHDNAVRAAKSIASHLDPEKGDGVIKPEIDNLIDELDEETSSLILGGPTVDAIPQADRKAMAAYYQGVANDLRACALSALGDKSGWKKPARVGHAPLSTTLADLKKVYKSVTAPSAQADASEEGQAAYNAGYTESVWGVLIQNTDQVFPATRLDMKMAYEAVNAAKSLSKHASDGNLTSHAAKSLASAKEILAEAEKPDGKYANQFPSEESRTAFINHYKGIVADLDACATELPQKTGKKPQFVRSYLHTVFED